MRVPSELTGREASSERTERVIVSESTGYEFCTKFFNWTEFSAELTGRRSVLITLDARRSPNEVLGAEFSSHWTRGAVEIKFTGRSSHHTGREAQSKLSSRGGVLITLDARRSPK